MKCFLISLVLICFYRPFLSSSHQLSSFHWGEPQDSVHPEGGGVGAGWVSVGLGGVGVGELPNVLLISAIWKDLWILWFGFLRNKSLIFLTKIAKSSAYSILDS